MKKRVVLLILFVFFLLDFPVTAGGGKGTLIVLNKFEATASVIPIQTGKTAITLGTGIGPHEVAVSPDGLTAVVCNYGERPKSTLTVIDLKLKKPVRTIHLGEYQYPHGIEFHPRGEEVLVTAEKSRALVRVNIREGKIVRAYSTGELNCHMAAVTPDWKFAVGTDIRGGKACIIDLAGGDIVRIISTGQGAEGVAVTPDGREAWVTNRASDTLSVISLQSYEITDTIPSSSFPIRIRFTPDGKHALVSNARSGDIGVFDTVQKKEVRKIRMKVRPGEDMEGRLFYRFGDSPMPVGLVIPPDGTHCFVANTNADIVTVIDLKKWAVTGRLRAGKEPDGMAWSPASVTR